LAEDKIRVFVHNLSGIGYTVYTTNSGTCFEVRAEIKRRIFYHISADRALFVSVYFDWGLLFQRAVIRGNVTGLKEIYLEPVHNVRRFYKKFICGVRSFAAFPLLMNSN
jgi:hypothetical protein